MSRGPIVLFLSVPPEVGSACDGAIDGTGLHTKEEKRLPWNVYERQCERIPYSAFGIMLVY